MSDKINASPAAQKLARANKLDLGEVKGTGNGGQITKPDVEKAIEVKNKPAETAKPAEPPAPADEGGSSGESPAVAEAPAETPPVEEPQPSGDSAQLQPPAPTPPPAVPEAEIGDKGEVRYIEKLTDNLGVTWWCPFDDYSQPGEHMRCGRCGATRGGGGVAALGDEVTAA